MKAKEIKIKIKSVGNIKKITKTMEMVSVSKMRRAVDHALGSRSYAHYALELLINMSRQNGGVHHPLLEAGKGDKELVIIITSNKGLCGGYHTNLFKAMNSYMKNYGGLTSGKKEITAITVGKYAEKICKKLEISVFASFISFNEHSDIEQTRDLSNLAIQEFKKGEYKSVKILYTEFLKSTTYKPVMEELFPISAETVKNVLENEEGHTFDIKADSLVDYKFEPDLNTILKKILPGLVDVVVFQALAESFASEHSARMFAMKNAGDNATTILDALMLSYNHARQDGITRELSEIVAGAEALSTN